MTTLEREGEQGPAQAWEVRVTEEENRTGKGPREGKETGSQPRWLVGMGGGGVGSGLGERHGVRGQNQRRRELAGNRKQEHKVGHSWSAVLSGEV